MLYNSYLFFSCMHKVSSSPSTHKRQFYDAHNKAWFSRRIKDIEKYFFVCIRWLQINGCINIVVDSFPVNSSHFILKSRIISQWLGVSNISLLLSKLINKNVGRNYSDFGCHVFRNLNIPDSLLCHFYELSSIFYDFMKSFKKRQVNLFEHWLHIRPPRAFLS